MDFLESEEQGLLRTSVYKIASKYGHEYYSREARGTGKADELWRELAEAGFLGVNLPAEHGGAGLGIYELAIVCEEQARAGTPFLLLIVSPAICGNARCGRCRSARIKASLIRSPRPRSKWNRLA